MRSLVSWFGAIALKSWELHEAFNASPAPGSADAPSVLFPLVISISFSSSSPSVNVLQLPSLCYTVHFVDHHILVVVTEYILSITASRSTLKIPTASKISKACLS